MSKANLAFLLNPPSSYTIPSNSSPTTSIKSEYVQSSTHSPVTKRPRSVLSIDALCGVSKLEPVNKAPRYAFNSPRKPSPIHNSRRKTGSSAPLCEVQGCTNHAVSRRCCVRHGGGTRCIVAGCTNRAKLNKRCCQHGGVKTCSVSGCTRKAKSYGCCWSHGGGRLCRTEGCTKVSTQGGHCWAHGGGNRCKLEGCSRRSYQKFGYHCLEHASLHTPSAIV